MTFRRQLAAGIAGLRIMNALGILAAAVDSMTARIGEGDDSYRTGLISVVNEAAKSAGVRLSVSRFG